MLTNQQATIYNGEGDRLMQSFEPDDRIVLLCDTRPSKVPDRTPRIRLMWGQHLLEDLLTGRYHSLVCAVNAVDNAHGIIAQLATLLPTSQWDVNSITSHAQRFAQAGGPVKVIKYDLDTIEILAILRPTEHEHLTLTDLGHAFRIVSEMIQNRPTRLPSASVSFLGARSNALHDENGREPSLEAVLRTMYDAGYTGDVYPAPHMWECAPTAVYARYPFPPSLEAMRHGGF